MLTPSALHAQGRGAYPPSSPTSQLTFRGFGDAGVTVFSATQSFKAILRRPAGPLFGGGLELGLPKRLFLSVGASRFRRTGHRVFAFQGEVFELNEPATITITPLEITMGYRHTGPAQPATRAALPRTHPIRRRGGRMAQVHGTWRIRALPTTCTRRSRGTRCRRVEMALQKWMALAAEAQFAPSRMRLARIRTAVSSVYNEHDLGGFTFRVKVVVGR